MTGQRVVLITGASSGVGQATARHLAQHGYSVFGTSRDPARAEAIPGVEMLALDVRSDAGVSACVTAVMDRAGRLDLLVNNAGYELAGAIEETSLDEARAQFETNFFGVVRMVGAVVPVMRRQRQGQIITIGSLSGLTSIPFMGLYSASKSALEGYMDALRMELAAFSIRVSLVEPAFLNTPMKHKRQVSAGQIPDYDQWRQRAFTSIRAQEEKGPGPQLVAESVLRIASSAAPRLRYLVGSQANFVARLMWLLPAGVYERAKMGSFGLT